MSLLPLTPAAYAAVILADQSTEEKHVFDGRRRLDQPGDVSRRRQQEYNITQLWSHHREVIRRIALGQKHSDIASDLGLSVMTVRNIVNSPLVRREIDHLQLLMDANVIDVQKRIAEVAPLALRAIEEVMDSPFSPPAIKLSAAKHLLGVAGFVAPQKHEIKRQEAFCSFSFIERIKQRQEVSVNSEVILEEVLDES